MQSTANENRWSPTDKQTDALILLNDKTTSELFYGGGAGGGKSYLGCMWLLTNCFRYPNTRWVMARAELKSLRLSTFLTFLQICHQFGLKKDERYQYRASDGVVRFPDTGSEIYLRELKADPSDPEFDKLGSTEYTGAFIDEGSQISFKGYNVLMSRLRYRLEEYRLIPKILICSNPTKNFLHYEFYKPWQDKKLPSYRAMIQSLVTDNPHISPFYVENLKKLPKPDMERLLYGNWDYEDDPSKLFEFDSITDIFMRPGLRGPEKYLTVDVARFGADKTAFVTWEGFFISNITLKHGLGTDETEAEILKKCAEENIARSHVAIDEDGIGGGVVDHLKGCYGFLNNGKTIDVDGKKANYQNLKSQCYFYLADAVAKGEIGCYKSIDSTHKKLIIEDLEQIKRAHPNEDRPLAVISKDEIKEKLGRSPDLGDALMMRMVFAIKKPTQVQIGGWTNPRELPMSKADSAFLEHIRGA